MQGKSTMLIVMQDFPDPDAIAAAYALKELGRSRFDISTSTACSGLVGRAENLALVRYLKLNPLDLSSIDVSPFDLIAMVDTQPGSGNNSLAPDRLPNIVIDHHPTRPITRRVEFHDIRSRYGATSTILYEYLEQEGIELDMVLATGLAYGIKSDTQELGQKATDADIRAFHALYPLANTRKLGRMEMTQLPRVYFQSLAAALHHARTYGKCIVSRLGELDNPDMLGEAADLLLRNEESDWALCLGSYRGRLLLSLRTSDAQSHAGRLMHRLVGRQGSGGGHSAMAGGQIPLNDRSQKEVAGLETAVVRHLLRLLRMSGEKGQPLLAPAREP
jgi:nanoRNase/pAp phosphatase (c-di-AMP/oligoRNAs hydrolase)